MMGYLGYGNYGYGMDYYGFGHLIGFIVTILVIVLVISLIRRGRMCKHHHGSWHGMCSGHEEGNNALELLKERYVKGEIERAEFEQKKKDLTN